MEVKLENFENEVVLVKNMEVKLENFENEVVLLKHKNLWEAFKKKKEELFDRCLELGANPEQIVDQDAKLSTFELLCQEPDAGDYILKCLDLKSDPNRKNPYNGYYPIHLAVRSVAVENVKILLEADPECANQTINFDKTPLHLLAEVADNLNLSKVFEIIKIFSKFDGHFLWPARKSGNQTPFSMFQKNLSTLSDKETCTKILTFFTEINVFEKEKIIEDQVWRSQQEVLKDLLELNEADFLMKFDIQKNSNRLNLEEYFSNEDHLIMTIKMNRFESFAEIYEMNFKKIDTDKVFMGVLEFRCCRMLKHLLDHHSVTHVDPKWMLKMLDQMGNKEADIGPKTQRCFHILLGHPKYNVNERIPNEDNWSALQWAAIRSEYATVELLKAGALLGNRDNDDIMAIQYIYKSVLKEFLDSCITICVPEDQRDIDYFMVIDYSCLKGAKETPTIGYMSASEELQDLIEHPVIASFLFLKWLRLSNIFYLNLLLFSLQAMSFGVYLILFYVGQDSHNTHYKWLAYWSFIVFTAKELSQFIGSPTSYLKSVEDYFEFGVIGLMAVTLFIPFEDQQIRRSLAAVLFLGFAIEWTLIFGALPMFSASNYIVMLRKVTINFLRMLAFYSIILMAFTLSFYTMINQSEGANKMEQSQEPDESNNTSLFSAFFYVILMLTGDFDAISNGVIHLVIVRIFLLVFVLSMSIVMMNLLIGLTVSDTVGIRKEAEWYKWFERAKLLMKYESMAWNCLRWLKGWKWAENILTSVLLMPDYLPMNKIKIEVSSYPSWKWIFIPQPLKPNDDNDETMTRDNEGDPFPLMDVKERVLSRSYFGYSKYPLEMDEQIIENGLQVLKCNHESWLKKASEKQEQAYRDEIKKRMDEQKCTVDKIEQKLDQLLNQRQG